MTTQTLRSRATLTFVLLLFPAGLALLARPRSPLPPYPEMDLRSWRFDQTNAVDAEHLGAISAKDISLVESWSGYAWDVVETSSAGGEKEETARPIPRTRPILSRTNPHQQRA